MHIIAIRWLTRLFLLSLVLIGVSQQSFATGLNSESIKILRTVAQDRRVEPRLRDLAAIALIADQRGNQTEKKGEVGEKAKQFYEYSVQAISLLESLQELALNDPRRNEQLKSAEALVSHYPTFEEKAFGFRSSCSSRIFKLAITNGILETNVYPLLDLVSQYYAARTDRFFHDRFCAYSKLVHSLDVAEHDSRSLDKVFRRFFTSISLKSIGLKNRLISPADAHLLVSSFPGLEILDLTGAQLNHEVIERIKELRFLASISLNGTLVSHLSLVHLKALKHSLMSLDLGSTKVDAEGLAHVKELQNLTSLILRYTQVCPTGLFHVRQLPRLSLLDLTNAPLTQDGLIQATKAKNLTSLDLTSTNLGEGDLQPLETMSRGMTHLTLNSTPTTDFGLSYLRNHSGLLSLFLRGTKITDSGLGHLRGLHSLTELDLSHTSILGDTLEHLVEGLKRLRSLNVLHTGVKDETKARLSQLRPDLVFY